MTLGMHGRLTALSICALVVLAGYSSGQSESTDGSSPSVADQESELIAWDGSCNPAPNELGLYDAQNYKEALLCSIEDFAWPEKFKPDEDLIDTYILLNDQWSATNYSPESVPVVLSSSFATCAWAAEWQDASNSGADDRLDVAVNYLNRYGTNPEENVVGYPSDGQSPETQEYMKSIVEKIAVGDPSGITEIMDMGCSQIPWSTSEPGE